MPDTGFLALFLVGLLGGTHCVGMCGGIVGALSLGQGRWLMHFSYNAGRIASYALAGALAGWLGGASVGAAGQWPLRLVLFGLANLMLLALGLYLMGFTRALSFTEKLGQRLWLRLQPLGKRWLPARTPAQALMLGGLWGWLPCGLVYSALASALTTGSALRGSALMLCFGLGTLPNLLLAGMLLTRFSDWIRSRLARFLSGALVFSFGVWGMLGVFRLLASGGW